jgi:hypothetical protein
MFCTKLRIMALAKSIADLKVIIIFKIDEISSQQRSRMQGCGKAK